MKLEQLTQMIEIANAGSFSQAARNLYISQPNLSRSVKQLEEELGFRIYERKSDGVVLTPEGAALMERARIIDGACQSLIEQYGKKCVPFKQTLRIASLHCRVTSFVPPNILKHVGTPTNISMINCTSLNEILHLVETLQVDCANIGILSPYVQSIKTKLSNLDMEYHLISRCNLYAAIGPKNPLYEKCDSVFLAQLTPFTIISYATASVEAQQNYAVALGLDHATVGSIQTNNPKIFYQTIHESAAVGIVAIPPDKFSDLCEYKDLRLLSLTDSKLSVEYAWIKLRRVPLSELAQEAILVREQIY